MIWKDEGYLLSKSNFDENSLIIETFTFCHGKYSGIVYGGSSRKKKKIFQIGNKILLNWKSKSENKMGYFDVELIKPVSPIYFDDKKKSACILSASSILKILLPERQLNKKIYKAFDKFIDKLNENNWIKLYIHWELSLINDLGFETNFKNIKLPTIINSNNKNDFTNFEINEALIFNKKLFLDNFFLPNNIKIPLSRILLEKYYANK